MKLYKLILLNLVIMLAVSTVATAQVGLKKVGQSTMNFLLVNVSPRAAALGETFIAVGEGAESIFFNPAGIVESPSRFDFKMCDTRWIADINYMADAIVWNAGNMGSFGLSVLWVDYGTINGTSLITEAESSMYPLGYRDDGALDDVGAIAIGLTYGRAISDRFLIGGNLRYVEHNLGSNTFSTGETIENKAVKLVFDAGVKYYTGLKSLRFGMAIRNFSSNLKREKVYEPLPLLFTMGAAMDIFQVFPALRNDKNELMLAVDFLHPNNYTERANFGLEYVFMKSISFRGGYQTNQDIASWSCGLGLATGFSGYKISFDYSYSEFEVFQNVNRFSIGVAF